MRHALRRLKRRRGADRVQTPLALLLEDEQPAAAERDRDAALAAREALAAAFAAGRTHLA